MPNHCDNDLYVRGPKAAVTALLAQYVTPDGELDCNAVLPYPAEYAAQDAAARAWMVATPAERDALGPCPKDGFNSGGYEWCCTNWGTKWGTYSASPPLEQVALPGHRRVKLNFLSAWGPPLPVVEALARLCPEVNLTLRYYECGMAFKGVLKVRGREVLEASEGNYTGTRGG